jgi:predicted membrane-bound mannosyltransferase
MEPRQSPHQNTVQPIPGVEKTTTNQRSWDCASSCTAILKITLLITALIVALLFGMYRLGATFRVYDDEGYVLLALDHYRAGEHLYSEVFSEFGPFYFFTQGAVFRLLKLPMTHDAGRLVTLITWIASAAFGG